MKFRTKVTYLLLLTLMAIAATAALRRMPLNPLFHRFADIRTLWGVPNFLNVISNLPFLLVGVYGLSQLNKPVARAAVKLIYGVLFAGILLVAFGSAYYHLSPDNDRLIWDRIPMTIVFTAFLSATISGLIGMKAGTVMLFPLVILGIISVLSWYYTEQHGNGDQRFYGFIQFYPMVLIPLIMVLFPSSVSKRQLRLLAYVIGWYVIAKLLEHFDDEIYVITGVVSGHSLKHIAAAVATWYIVKIYQDKYLPASPTHSN